MICGGLRTKGIHKKSEPEKPLVTVVTVVFNGEKTLEQTIQSVVNQTYVNVEYIIIDGASTDGTLDIIKKYENKIDYWQSEPDKGIYDAMNKGIDFAKGEWINFMNSGDEFYEKSTIEKIAKNLLNFNIDVIYGNVITKWAWGKELSYPLKKDKIMPFCHQSCFTKSYLLKDLHFDTKYKICADRNFYYQAKKKYKKYNAFYINEALSIFDSTEGLSSNNQEDLLKECAEIENMSVIKFYFSLFKLKLKKKFPNQYKHYRKVQILLKK